MQWIEQLAQQITNDWDWNTFWPETLGKATGVIIGIAVSWFLLIRRRLQSMNRLKSGDSDDVLFQAHYLAPVPDADPVSSGNPASSGNPVSRDRPESRDRPSERVVDTNDDRTGAGDANRHSSVRSSQTSYQLLFRNVAEKKTVPQIYDNPAAAELVKTLGDQTSLNQPILPTEGTIGFEVLNDAANWISGVLATSSNERQVWLFCMTAEDRQVVRKRCVRCFLIRPDDLIRFHDWRWCRDHVRVERPWHWFRVVALHRVARLYADQCRMHSDAPSATAMPLVDDQAGHRRIVSLSLGLMETERAVVAPFVVDWATQLSTPTGRQLILEEGDWPAELMSS